MSNRYPQALNNYPTGSESIILSEMGHVDNHNQLEHKLGAGASQPEQNTVLVGEGAGISKWSNQVKGISLNNVVLTNAQSNDGTLVNPTISNPIFENTTLSGLTIADPVINGGTISGTSISGGLVDGANITGATITNMTIDNHVALKTINTPVGAPEAGHMWVYFKTDGNLYSKNENGQEVLIVGGGGGGSGSIISVNGQVGTVVLSKADIGLDRVDNTADTEKPLSNAAISALSNKADLVSGVVPLEQLPKRDNEIIALIAMSETAPASASIGSYYYNSSSKLIYHAVSTNTWDMGHSPKMANLYIDVSSPAKPISYCWIGENMANVSTLLDYSSQEEAETGTDNTKVMTALRVAQAINKFAPKLSREYIDISANKNINAEASINHQLATENSATISITAESGDYFRLHLANTHETNEITFTFSSTNTADTLKLIGGETSNSLKLEAKKSADIYFDKFDKKITGHVEVEE